MIIQQYLPNFEQEDKAQCSPTEGNSITLDFGKQSSSQHSLLHVMFVGGDRFDVAIHDDHCPLIYLRSMISKLWLIKGTYNYMTI